MMNRSQWFAGAAFVVAAVSLLLSLQGYCLTALGFMVGCISLGVLYRLNGTGGSPLVVLLLFVFSFAYLLKVPFFLSDLTQQSRLTDILVNSYDYSDFQTAYALLVATLVNFILCIFMILIRRCFGGGGALHSLGIRRAGNPREGATLAMFGLLLLSLLLNYFMLEQGWGMLGVPLQAENLYHMAGTLSYSRTFLIPAFMIYVFMKYDIKTIDVLMVFTIALMSGMAGLSKSVFIINIAVAFIYYVWFSARPKKANYLALAVLSILSILALQTISSYRVIIFLAANNDIYLGSGDQLALAQGLISGESGEHLYGIDGLESILTTLYERVLGFREFLLVFYADESLSSRYGQIQLMANIGMDMQGVDGYILPKELYGGPIPGGVGCDYIGKILLSSEALYILPVILAVSILLSAYDRLAMRLAFHIKERIVYYFLTVILLLLVVNSDYVMIFRLMVVELLLLGMAKLIWRRSANDKCHMLSAGHAS